MHSITLTGSPREQGNQHGESFKKEIRELHDIRYELILKYLNQLKKEEVDELALKQVEYLKAHPELFEEFSGIAESSNLSHSELMILNNYTDMRDFYAEPTGGPGDYGCSVFAFRNSHSSICGQTWDMHASATPYVLHIRSEEEGHVSEILTLTGCLALTGVNSQSIAVMINNLHCSETHIGLAWPALVRAFLRQKNHADALLFIEEHLPCSGHNYLIAAPNEFANLETTGKQFEITDRGSDNYITYHTNHYLSRLKEFEIGDRRSLTTDQRMNALQSAFEEKKLEDLNQSWAIESILKNPVLMLDAPEGQPHGSATCGGIVLELGKRRGIVFGGLWSAGDHREISW